MFPEILHISSDNQAKPINNQSRKQKWKICSLNQVFNFHTENMSVGHCRDGGLFFWSSWLFITSSSCFKTINRQEALLPTLIISHKDKFEVQIELLWAIKRKVSMVWKKIYQSSACKFIYTIIFSQYVLFKCAQQNYTMATWQISFLVLAKCVCHIR